MKNRNTNNLTIIYVSAEFILYSIIVLTFKEKNVIFDFLTSIFLLKCEKY